MKKKNPKKKRQNICLQIVRCLILKKKKKMFDAKL